MSDDPKKCNLQGSVLRDGVCYLGDAPVLETAAEMKERIDENSADGKETLVFFTSNWCHGCKIVKPLVEEGSANVPADIQMLVCDTSQMHYDTCLRMATTSRIPNFERFDVNGVVEREMNWSRMFNYYLAGQQIGIKTSLDSPFGDEMGLGAGIIANIQTPLMKHDIATQFAATVHLGGDEFRSADIEAKIYSPTVGDLIPLSPVRFLGLYVGTGLQTDGDSAGMINSIGMELVRGNLMSWLISAEAGIYEFDPFSRSREWFPNISLTLGHSL